MSLSGSFRQMNFADMVKHMGGQPVASAKGGVVYRPSSNPRVNSPTRPAASGGIPNPGMGSVRQRLQGKFGGSFDGPRVVSYKTNQPKGGATISGKGAGYGVGGSGGGGGGATGGGSQQEVIQQLIEQMGQGQSQAKSAGLQRYTALLDMIAGLQKSIVGPGGTFAQAQKLLEGSGATARRRVGEDTTRAMASAEQDLISRGLGNTTIRTSARRGIASDAERHYQDIDQQVRQEQAGLLTQRAGAEAELGRLRADAILSRQDTGPDTAAYTNLIMALASL